MVLRVVAENIQFMNRRRDEGQGAGNQGYQQNNNYQQGGNFSGGYQSGGFPQANSGYQAPGAGAPPRRQMDAPPMPEPDFGGDAGMPPEDDIPF